MPSEQQIPILSHAVGGVFVESRLDGQLDVLAHSYRKGGRTTLRVPVGSGRPGESLAHTLRREMLDEVAGSDDFAFRLILPEPVYWERAADDNTRQNTHLKVFFALAIERGRHRDRELFDQAGTPEQERLGPLYWYEIGDLLRDMRSECSPRVHRLAVAGTLLAFAAFSSRVRGRYERDLAHWQTRREHFEKHESTVAEYLSRP
jgi:hypothetical protein